MEWILYMEQRIINSPRCGTWAHTKIMGTKTKGFLLLLENRFSFQTFMVLYINVVFYVMLFICRDKIYPLCKELRKCLCSFGIVTLGLYVFCYILCGMLYLYKFSVYVCVEERFYIDVIFISFRKVLFSNYFPLLIFVPQI